jgi:hypothetical protein
MQVDCAFWNVGDDGLIEEVPENPPFLFGSGKSGRRGHGLGPG